MGFGLGAASFYMVIGLILVSILTMWRATPRLARTQSEAFTSTPAES
jgi:hypothetical protein